MEINKTIQTVRLAAKQKKRCKILSVLLVMIIFISCTIPTAFGSTNDWGLETSYIVAGTDGTYFITSERYISDWSASRRSAWTDFKNLLNTFNKGVLDRGYTSSSSKIDQAGNSAVAMLEYMYDEDSDKAVNYANKWNQMFTDVCTLTEEGMELCGTDSLPQVDSKNVTTEDYLQFSQKISDKLSEYNTLFSQIQSSFYSLNYESDSTFNAFSTGAFGWFNWLWNQLGQFLLGFGSDSTDTADTIFGISFGETKIEEFATSIANIVKTFAYALVVILFGVNLTSTALQFELLTLRGGVKVFARVLLAKIWVDLSVKICMYTISLCNDLGTQILQQYIVGNLFSSQSYVRTTDLDNSWWNFIGTIINFFTSFIYNIPMLILAIVITICMLSVFVKIIARAFELTCLVSLSPLFFATLVGENTKQYFRKFFNAFLSTAGYFLYLSVVYAVGSAWITEVNTTVAGDWVALIQTIIFALPRSLVLMGVCHVMRKPPKVLQGLVD